MGNCLSCEFKEGGQVVRRGLLIDWEFSTLIEDVAQRDRYRGVVSLPHRLLRHLVLNSFLARARRISCLRNC